MLNAIINRRSCRKYLNQEVDNDCLIQILNAAQYSPTGKNTRGWEFIVIRDVEIQNKLTTVSHQKFALAAPIIIVPIINTHLSIFPIEDVSATTTIMLIQAKELGLDSVWVHVGASEEDSFKQILSIPDHFLVINLILIGYCATPTLPHIEEEVDIRKVHINKYGICL